MSRKAWTQSWGRLIPIVVLATAVVACAKSPREVEQQAAPPKEQAAPPRPLAQQPASAPVPVPSSPISDQEPTPAETPVSPTPVAPDTAQNANPAATPTTSPDPLQQMMGQEAARQDYQKRLVELATEADTARAFVSRAERDLLALRNPYLARPVLTPEESAMIQGMNGAERVKWAESRLADAIASLKAAEQAYDDSKANPPGN